MTINPDLIRQAVAGAERTTGWRQRLWLRLLCLLLRNYSE